MTGEIPRPGRATPATTEISEHLQTLLGFLEHGQLFWFADWPVAAVPRSGAIVYTVWDRSSRFIYVGMAGRGETTRTGASGDAYGSHRPGVLGAAGFVSLTFDLHPREWMW